AETHAQRACLCASGCGVPSSKTESRRPPRQPAALPFRLAFGTILSRRLCASRPTDTNRTQNSARFTPSTTTATLCFLAIAVAVLPNCTHFIFRNHSAILSACHWRQLLRLSSVHCSLAG